MLLGARRLLHRLVNPDGDQAMKLLRQDVRRLTRAVADLEAAHARTSEIARRADRSARRIELVSALDARHREEVARLPELLDERRIEQHVRAAVAAAPMLTDPYEHIVVERVLPEPVYDLLVRAIPPPEFFDDRDPIKQNLVFPMESGPALSAAVWGFMDTVVARRIIRPAVVEKFREPLDRHLTSMFGADALQRARELPQAASGGRVMLRRPGYHLDPHRDPKRSMLTCLMYLAREGDSPEYGTQIFRVLDDGEASYKQTYYPREEGRTCELVKVVPFTPNTMLVNLNSRGAHGATIPPEAPADVERYAYQFYIAPLNEALAALIKSLPAEKRKMWRDKGRASRHAAEGFRETA